MHTHTHTYICVNICICLCIYVCTYIYVCTHIYTYAHTHYICSVGLGCRMHWLFLCSGVRLFPPPTTANECPGHDSKQSGGEIPVILELWRMRSTPSLPLLPGPQWPWVVVPDRVPSISQKEVNCVLMLNWIGWNRTALMFKLRTYAKLKCLKWKCFCTLNWIGLNRTVYTLAAIMFRTA